MATRCPHCGEEVAKEHAQFCNHCGKRLPTPLSEPQMPREQPGIGLSPSPVPARPVLREQTAYPPAPRASRAAREQGPPDWLSTLGSENEASRRGFSERAQSPRRAFRQPAQEGPPDWPEALTHVSQEREVQPPLEARAQVESAKVPPRELHVKVWGDDEKQEPVPLQEARETESEHPPVGSERAVEDFPTVSELAIEDFPTQHEGAALEDMPTRHEVAAVKDIPIQPQIAALEYLPTRSLPSAPATPLQKPEEARDEIDKIADLDTALMPASARPVTPLSPVQEAPIIAAAPVASFAQAAPEQSPQQRVSFSSPSVQNSPPPTGSNLPPPASSARKKSRLPLVAAVLLLVLLLGAGGTWIVLAKPFTVAEITQPWQNYSAQNLALRYPTGWPTPDKSATGMTIHDSSNTAKVVLTSTEANGTDALPALQQQASKLNLSGTKGAEPLTFANATWQRLQGSMQIDGASYSVTLLGTVHNNRLYVWQQMAAQSVSADYEKAIFQPMRVSLRFL